jgi:cytidyltransferase-like protein
MKIILVTGGFDPIHSGHISYLNHADHLRTGNEDWLIVGLNSDAWLARKKGRPFMSWRDRMVVLDNLHMTDKIIDFDDSDGTACDAIRKVKEMYPGAKIIFANGGDRTKENIPEMIFDDVEFVFGVGGADKENSSSWILDDWKTQRTERPWGYWRVLDDKKITKVKELVIEPGKSLSDQRHFHRSEHWYILNGSVKIITEYNGLKSEVTLTKNSTYIIGNNVWHLSTNVGTEPCHILEVQYGDMCIEEDIERR